MDIWSPNRLILFLAFVIPGFVSLKAYELLFPSMPKDSSKRLIDAIVYSCINYALLFWPIYEVETSQLRSLCPSVYFAFYFFVLFIVPVVLAPMATSTSPIRGRVKFPQYCDRTGKDCYPVCTRLARRPAASFSR
ncbi:MAG: DUF6338 family protein [Acidiferrobacterales bacterium]